MSNVPADLKYTESHEWVRDAARRHGRDRHHRSCAGRARRPGVRGSAGSGPQRQGGRACAVVESVKAASDVYAPLAGEVTAGNPQLAAQPEAVNKDPYGAGWLMRLKPAAAGARCGGAACRPADYQKRARRGGWLMAFIPHTAADVAAMLAAIGAPSIEALFDEIPAELRVKSPRRRARGAQRDAGRAPHERARARRTAGR